MTHPARYSKPVLDLTREILLAEWPEFMGRPMLHDPCAGTGERLHEFCNSDGMWWPYSGTEIEECYIEAPGILHGNSTRADTYPPARWPETTPVFGWLIFTSVVYPNGMADNHLARDGSPRKNYRKAKAEITGDEEAELDPDNAGNYGYRGTKRPEDGGTSRKREAYWDIHRRMLPHWETAEMVILNASDFKHSNGRVEPVVKDWRDLLHEFGWSKQVAHPVGTQRMKHGQNADQRVAHEVVIVARR